MRIVGIDPGPGTSGVVEVDASVWPPPVLRADAKAADDAVTMYQYDFNVLTKNFTRPRICVCEWLTSYGLAVGATVFDTARKIGRFEQQCIDKGITFHTMVRPDVALELVGTRRAKDAQIHEAVRQIYRDAGMAYGGGKDATKGTKAKPGPLYQIKSHSWDALAVVLAWMRKEGQC